MMGDSDTRAQVRSGDLARLLAEAARHPVLAPDEERMLTARAEQGDADALRRLVGSHLRYVVRIARSYRGWGVPMADLVQEGTLALVQAVRRFDPDRDVRLSTYAAWWIRQAMQDSALRSWSVVRLGTSNAQRMLALKLRRLVDGWGHEWLDEERLAALADQFGTTLQEVVRLARRMAGRDSSLDAAGAGGPGLIDRLISDWPSPEQLLARVSEHRIRTDALKAALARLSPREQLILHRRYLDDAHHTFEAIGRDLGVSKERVRHLERRALSKLRAILQPLRQSWAGG
jgi:RNA polymerase sigma-32 factor